MTKLPCFGCALIWTVLLSMTASVYSDVLEDVCNVYKTSVNSSVAVIQYSNGECTMTFKVPNQPRDNATDSCDELVRPLPASAGCQLPTFDGVSNLLSRNLVSASDVFFLGATRSGCGSWNYPLFNDTLVPITAVNGVNLPANNVDCQNSAVVFNKGSIAAVDKNSYQTTVFVCHCFLTTSGSSPAPTGTPPVGGTTVFGTVSAGTTRISGGPVAVVTTTFSTLSTTSGSAQACPNQGYFNLIAQLVFLSVSLTFPVI